jgi:hypothetical protein
MSIRGGFVPGWDLLDDEPDQPADAKATSPAASAWLSLDDEPPADAHGGSAAAWYALDDEPEPAEPALPPPELTASQLRNGDVLWARVDGQVMTLGSGQPLHVPAGVPDGIGGWRRVRITDAASLRAEVLVFPVEQPVLGVADEPTLLFPPDPVRSPPLRPAGFPAGEGGDLSAAFEARVRDAMQHYRRAAAEAQDEFQRRADQVERQLREDYQWRIRTAEQQAEARYQEAVQQVQADASRRVEQASQAARQSHERQQQAERERESTRTALAKVGRERTRSLAAAAAGWVFVLVLLVVLIAR